MIDTEHRAPSLPFPASDFAHRTIKPRPWIVRDRIPGRQVSTIDGEGGGGKSTIALQLCVCVVSGRSWLGEPVEIRGPALYLASEDDADEIHRRLHCIAVHYSVDIDNLTRLQVWPLATEDPALVTAGRDDTIQTTPRWGQLVAAIHEHRPRLLVLDSRADVFAGSEISRAQVRSFIGLLRQLAIAQDMAVVLLSHPSLAGISSGSGSSGSTHWRNAVRAGLYLKRPEDPEQDPDDRVLEVVKSNYSARGMGVRLRWAAGAFEVVDGPQPANHKEAAQAIDAKFLDLLDSYTEAGRPVGSTNSAIY
ncbi:MAG: ATPase, partial [Caulobacteraceae bacterium]|nr:ATPase [Caulobacteraceae bacterium]